MGELIAGLTKKDRKAPAKKPLERENLNGWSVTIGILRKLVLRMRKTYMPVLNI